MAIPAPNAQFSSGYWGDTVPNTYHRNSTEREMSRILAKPANRGFRKVMRALNGVAPGAAVSDTYTRIANGTAFDTVSFGGVRQIETVTGIYNGNTTTAQRDYINSTVYDAMSTPQSYPVDLSGNGGGGKMQR